MKVTINNKICEVNNNIKADEIVKLYKNNADVIIVNGFNVDGNEIINENDEIILIKKGEIPTDSEFECMLMARHTPKIYEKLKNSSVAIAGLGGLGSNCAVTLSRMGVGKLKLIDYDVVEPSNLNRQYYFISQIGMKKTIALKNTIENINPYTKIECSDIYVTKDNIKENFTGYDVILECFDKDTTKAMFVENVIKFFPNSYLIAVSGIAGLYPHDIFTTKKLGKNCIILGDFINEAKKGVGLMASRAAIAANIQANMAIRYLIGEENR